MATRTHRHSLIATAADAMISAALILPYAFTRRFIVEGIASAGVQE